MKTQLLQLLVWKMQMHLYVPQNFKTFKEPPTITRMTFFKMSFKIDLISIIQQHK